MKKTKVLFVVNQFFKGGAELALLNLFCCLSQEKYEIDFIVLDHVELRNSICLIPDVPEWIRVFNASENEGVFVFAKKLFFKLYQKTMHRQLFRQSALQYVKNREYDAAVSFGEWFSSAFVAAAVHAKRKYQWIHADIDKAAFLHPDVIHFQQYFDRFIFVSGKSLQGAVNLFPFLRNRSCVIHNLINKHDLLQRSSENVELPFPDDGLPVLLTVANIRSEKNHLRQVEAMKLLRQDGIHFYWLNIGSLANSALVRKIEQAVKGAHLEKFFHVIGAVENPYPFMKKADAVCALSDHESWSMVITEAKALGTPVIATKTSGALEQIIDGETGVLCDFSARSVAERIKSFLVNPELQKRIRKNLTGFSCQDDTLRQLEPLLTNGKQKILYIFDNINYLSGARNAALAQVDFLAKRAEITLFTVEPCHDKALQQAYRVIDLADNIAFRSLLFPVREAVKDSQYSKKVKLIRVIYSLAARVHIESVVQNLLLKTGFGTTFSSMAALLNEYDTICVVSEASIMRKFVASLKKPRKIQWIPTDYVAWREYSSWTRAVTKLDAAVYSGFDDIVCLSPKLRERFIKLYPQFAGKTKVIPNFIEYDSIIERMQEPSSVTVDSDKYNIITIGRMDREKRYDRLLEIANELKKRKIAFHWYFVGGGVLFQEMQNLCSKMNLSDEVTLTGNMSNPYPLMKQCSLFVLLSEYEGTPVTIDEAKVVGLPVFATDVGGIADQLEHGRYGMTVSVAAENNVEIITKLLMEALKNSNKKARLMENDCLKHNKLVQKSLLMIGNVTL